MLHEVLAVHIVFLPVVDGLLERVPEEFDGGLREMVDAEYAQQRRLHEYDQHAHLGPERWTEHGLAVLPELRVRVVDGVQLETERAAADHVGRILGHHLANFDPVLSVFPPVQRLVDGRYQAVRALLHLAVHVLQLGGRE